MSEHLLNAVRTFTSTIHNPFDLPYLLAQLIDSSTTALEAQAAGLMLVGRDGELGFAAASDSSVAGIERVQAKTRAGACFEAFESNQLVVVPDLETLSERWPEYAERASEAGFESVLGVPLNAWSQTIGVLNVYRTNPGPWSEGDIETAEILGALGAGYILSATQRQAQTDLTDQLQEALDSRVVIEQAKGILMGRHQLDSRGAFDALRTHSRNNNRKLREVAEEIIAKSSDSHE